MKVIRVYDDRMVFYNNVAWEELCEDDIRVEYCTLDEEKLCRYIIDKISGNEVSKDYCWDIDPDLDYFVFLDTKWDGNKISNPHELADDIVIPEQIIPHLQSEHVIKIGVYSLYDLNTARELVNKLKEVDGLIDKVIQTPFNFRLFQPDEIICEIKEKISQW